MVSLRVWQERDFAPEPDQGHFCPTDEVNIRRADGLRSRYAIMRQDDAIKRQFCHSTDGFVNCFLFVSSF